MERLRMSTLENNRLVVDSKELKSLLGEGANKDLGRFFAAHMNRRTDAVIDKDLAMAANRLYYGSVFNRAAATLRATYGDNLKPAAMKDAPTYSPELAKGNVSEFEQKTAGFLGDLKKSVAADSDSAHTDGATDDTLSHAFEVADDAVDVINFTIEQSKEADLDVDDVRKIAGTIEAGVRERLWELVQDARELLADIEAGMPESEASQDYADWQADVAEDLTAVESDLLSAAAGFAKI